MMIQQDGKQVLSICLLTTPINMESIVPGCYIVTEFLIYTLYYTPTDWELCQAALACHNQSSDD